jgi:hypothetical protein
MTKLKINVNKNAAKTTNTINNTAEYDILKPIENPTEQDNIDVQTIKEEASYYAYLLRVENGELTEQEKRMRMDLGLPC